MAMMKTHISDSENYRRITNAGHHLIEAIQNGARYDGRKVRKWRVEEDYVNLHPTLHLYLEPLSIEYPGCAMPREGVPVPPAKPGNIETPQAREMRKAADLMVQVAECFKNIASMLDKS